MGPTFPTGAVGMACLLLRLQAALVVLQFVLTVGPSIPWSGAVGGVVILGLGLGFCTRTASLAGGVAILAYLVLATPTLALAGQAAGLFVLTLLGAGAYSIDGLLFGRREIRLRP